MAPSRDVDTGPADRPPEIASDLCWLLGRASRLLERRFATEAMAASGLTARQHQVLVAARDGDRTQVEIARILGLDTTTTAVTVDDLERMGLARRRVADHDRRARVVTVTPAGGRAARRCDQALAATQERILSRLGDRERLTFMRSLAVLASDDHERSDHLGAHQ